MIKADVKYGYKVTVKPDCIILKRSSQHDSIIVYVGTKDGIKHLGKHWHWTTSRLQHVKDDYVIMFSNGIHMFNPQELADLGFAVHYALTQLGWKATR